MDPLTLLLAGGSLASSIFGGGSAPSVGDTMDLASQYFGPGKPYGPQVPTYPSGSVTTPGGGGMTSTQIRNLNLGGNKKLQDLIANGKYKNLTSEQRSALSGGQDVDWTKLPKWMRQDLQKRGVQKPMAKPLTEYKSDPQANQLFNFLRDAELQRVGKQDAFNKQYIEPLIGQLTGLQGQAIGSASKYLKNGFTEVDPGVMASINKAADDSYNNLIKSYTGDYHRSLAGASEVLGVNGTPAAWDTGASQMLTNNYQQPFASGLANLESQREATKRDMINESLANTRAGYATVAGTPQFNAATAGLELPGISYNPAFTNPTGQFDPSLIQNQQQFQNQFGQQNSQFNQNLGMNLFTGAQGYASQPGPGAAAGSLLGNLAGFSMLGNKTPGNTSSAASGGGFFGGFNTQTGFKPGGWGNKLGTGFGNIFNSFTGNQR